MSPGCKLATTSRVLFSLPLRPDMHMSAPVDKGVLPGLNSVHVSYLGERLTVYNRSPK